MYKEQARMLGAAGRIAARLGKKWEAETHTVGAQVRGPSGARITIEAISEEAWQITCKPVNAMDTTYTFTALLTWGTDKIVSVLVRDYIPQYLRLLAERVELRSTAADWAEDTKDALEEIGQALSMPPRVWAESHDGEPNHVYGSFDLADAGEVRIEAAHRGGVTVRIKAQDIEVLRVLLPALAAYNKPAEIAEANEVQEEVACAIA